MPFSKIGSLPNNNKEISMSFFMKVIGNPFMKAILRSPFHAIMSKSVAVLTVTGKKSGKVYTFPVNYQRDGDDIWVVSMRDRTWWKNLRGGAKVTIRLAGREMKAHGEVFEEPQDVAQLLREFILRSPTYGRFLNVELDEEGLPVQGDIVAAAESRVMVRIKLS
jgi:deazaflavin-dependent oxidoreductase (nitroreductase family)